MTEPERIIRENILPLDFFAEEEIDDYFVSSEMKRIWAVGLDMLIKFDQVCKKHNLRYYLFFGTLLGAVRHKGFIPWDDDIDVVMPRKDYMLLMKLAEEFCYPLFLQTPYTDPGYYYSYIKLRNSNTTAITEQFRGQKINWGIMLDIYPIDYVDGDNGFDWYREIAKFARDNSNFMRLSNPSPDTETKKRMKEYSGRNPIDNYEKIQEIASRYETSPTKHVSVAVLTLHDVSNNYFWAEDFDTTVMAEFENMSFPIPAGYDRVLKILFGEYMKLPPKEQRGLWHSNVIFNADISYKDYIWKE